MRKTAYMGFIFLLAGLMASISMAVQLEGLTKTVAAAATPERLVSASSELRSGDVLIQALSTNTAGVWVGGSNVTSSGPGARLKAGEVLSAHNFLKRGSAQHLTLRDIWIAAEVDGEGVSVLYSNVNP